MTPEPTVLQQQPTDLNFVLCNRFRIIIHRTPDMVYFVQECAIPGITAGTATQATPFVDLPIPSDKLSYSDLVISFVVDAALGNYFEIVNWMTGLGKPKSFSQYKKLAVSQDGIYSDISLMILDAKSNPAHTIRFRGCFPVSISDLKFNATASDTEVQQVTAVFRYSYWDRLPV